MLFFPSQIHIIWKTNKNILINKSWFLNSPWGSRMWKIFCISFSFDRSNLLILFQWSFRCILSMNLFATKQRRKKDNNEMMKKKVSRNWVGQRGRRRDINSLADGHNTELLKWYLHYLWHSITADLNPARIILWELRTKAILRFWLVSLFLFFYICLNYTLNW